VLVDVPEYHGQWLGKALVETVRSLLRRDNNNITLFADGNGAGCWGGSGGGTQGGQSHIQ